MHRALAQFISGHAAHNCLLLVHPHIPALLHAAGEIAAEQHWPMVSVGAELSFLLLHEPPSNRPRAVRRWFGSRLPDLAPGPVVLTDIDLLREPAWELNMLALFLSASRTTRLVVAWPGTYANCTLAYAVPDHGLYRTWPKPAAMIADLT